MNGLVDQGVVVLEAGPDTLFCQGSPDILLGTAEALFSPAGEVVGVKREVLFQLVDDLGVRQKEDGAKAGPEAGDLFLGFGEGLVILDDAAQGVFNDVPNLVGRLAEQDNGPSGLAVEGGRRVADYLLDQVEDFIGVLL